ncbi:MAG: NHL repeat-containing protein [Melioribacteraceae bacterium]|nr:NHL repeat-containing protein [Melioribacteraceae bacterium]
MIFPAALTFQSHQTNIIYVTDIERNEIYKLDFEGNVLNFIGGYGWNPATFDEPVHIFASTLSVYVTDKNNDRIQYFDKDLNYLSQLRSDDLRGEYSFRYPTSAVVSPVGDLFVLDSDNSRILKFDLNGNFTTEIGSYDAGSFCFGKSN